MSTDGKRVTLAIRTYQRAQRIKALLEESGIDVVIHNLNLENPETAVGVRIRIKENDLPQALAIVEEKEKAWDEEKMKETPYKGKKILIPIDLTDQINEVAKFGFNLAKRLKADVTFLYAYYTPAYTIISSSSIDINTYSLSDGETLRRIVRTNNADVENMKNLVNRWIDIGELPKVNFTFEMHEGVPEDVILDYCRKEKPILVVMSTHGKNKDNEDELIGSVTAEVLESCKSPILAIPYEKTVSVNDVKRVAFFTNFDQKDLIAIDKAISFLKKSELEILFIHATDAKDAWDEVMLTGVKEYFANHYPEIATEYAFLKWDESFDKLQPFIDQAKIDLIAMNTKKRNVFARFFKRGLVTKIYFKVDTPLLVMHY